MMFCLDDGAELLYGPASPDEPATAILPNNEASEAATRAQIHATEKTAVLPSSVSNASSSKSFDKRLFLAPLALVIIVVGAFFGYRYVGSSIKQIESIAVMPFVNESGNADIEYLSDGMTETLIKNLSNLPNLNVKPRSTVFRYKGKDSDSQTIAKELNVQAILNGRVSQHGDQLTLSLELVDAQKDSVLWSEQYNRKQSDLVSLQSEIARDVSSKLSAKLSGADVTKVTKTYTSDPEAYQLYLKGRFHWNKRTYDDLLKAIEHFKAAVEKDDRFALAYSGLADTYSVLPYYRGSRSGELMQQAKPYALRAVDIDDRLAEAHTALAFVNEGTWNWTDAEKEYQRAIELNPNYGTAQTRYARFEVRVPRRNVEAVARLKQALQIEPSSLVASDNLSQTYLVQGDVDLAVEQAKRTVELDPRYSFGWLDLSYAYLKKGQNSEALTAAQKTAEVANRSSRSLVCLGFVTAMSGKRSEATTIVKELENNYQNSQADATEIAAIYAGLDDKDSALRWLNRAFDDRSSLLADIRAEFPFASLRDDLRFKDLLKRMNLPE
jgi:TolB-like protein/Tfp pilus assembly protein PilF